MRTKTPEQLARELDRLAEADRQREPHANDAALLEWAARALRQAAAEHAQQFRRAEAALRRISNLQTRIAALQAELTEARSNIRALEAVAARPAPIATEQHVEVDQRGNVKRVVSRPLPESRPIGFA